MTEIIVPIIGEDGAFTGDGLGAAQRVHHGMTLNICSPEFGADPTGVEDCTPAIQAAFDKGRRLSAFGVVTILCPAGVYRVAPPFVHVWGHATLRGDGIGSTIFLIDSSKIDDSTVENGVFHTGTYAKRADEPSIYRVSLSDFSIYTSLKSGAPSYSVEKGFQHIAVDQMNSKAWGITFNTNLGAGPSDPDSVQTLENIEIWDAAGGVAFLGLDDQGCKTTNLRVRRTWNQGLLVGKPHTHPEGYENGARRTGAADNKFLHADISGANQGQVGCAGIEVYTAQTKFLNSTSWYHRRHAEDVYSKTVKVEGDYSTYDSYDNMRDGAGWYIDGTRNIFIGCTSQETGGHGWVVKGSQTQMAVCIGESASYFDTAGPKDETGKGLYKNTAACFYIANWTHTSQLYGLRAQDAYNLGEASKWGFYVENYIKHFRLDSALTVNSKGKEADGTDKMQNSIPTESALIGIGTQMTVDGRTFPATASGGSGIPVVPWSQELTPYEAGSLLAHWDASASMTAEAGKVSALPQLSGSAVEQLAQADELKRPVVSSLVGKPAFRTSIEAGSFMQSQNITSTPTWSVALAVAVHSKANSQYLLSAIGVGAIDPASIVVTDKLGLRLNSGGGTGGYTAKTADNALTLHKPHVVVMVNDGATVQAWVDGVKSAETPVTAGVVKPLSGRLALGAYYAGTNAASATFGEAALFSTALTDTQVAGVSAYLGKKWG